MQRRGLIVVTGRTILELPVPGLFDLGPRETQNKLSTEAVPSVINTLINCFMVARSLGYQGSIPDTVRPFSFH